MKDAARPDPLVAAQRVKEGVRDLARGAIGAAGDIASDLAEGYRKSTRYVRMRAAIVASWALLSLVTLWAACPSVGPANALGAEAQLLPSTESILGAQILVKNDSRQVWTDVVFTLDGGWKLARRTMRPGDRVVVSVAQFQRGDSRAPSDLEPRAITVECREGRVTAPLAAR